MTLRKIVFDTETTGLSKDKQAVEAAMIEIDDDLNILWQAQALLKPTVPIAPEAQAIHGISHEMVADCPTIEEWVASEFGGPLDGDIALIGHRVGFDRPLFAPIGKVSCVLDTLILAQVYVTDAPNRKLDTLKEHLGLPGGGESHRAMADVLTCYQLLQRLMPLTGRTLDALCTQPYTILHHCPWGKHEGKLLMEVPRSYREWMLTLEDLDINLRKSLELAALTDPPRKEVIVGATPRRIYIPPRRR